MQDTSSQQFVFLYIYDMICIVLALYYSTVDTQYWIMTKWGLKPRCEVCLTDSHELPLCFCTHTEWTFYVYSSEQNCVHKRCSKPVGELFCGQSIWLKADGQTEAKSFPDEVRRGNNLSMTEGRYEESADIWSTVHFRHSLIAKDFPFFAHLSHYFLFR